MLTTTTDITSDTNKASNTTQSSISAKPRKNSRRGNGEGAISRRASDGLWQASMSLESGKRRYFYAKTEREVRQKLREAQASVEKGLPLVSDKQTMDQYTASWLATVRPNLKPRTQETYEQLVRIHVLPTLGRVALAQITPQQLQQLYAARLDAGASTTTVHHVHAVIHKMLFDALRLGLVQRNVSDLVDAPSMRHREMTVLTPEQARILLGAAQGDRLYALYALALSTGMRQGELLGMHWREVDLDAGTVYVRYTLQAARNGPATFGTPKTAKSRRTIKISASVVQALRAHHSRQLEERLSAGPAWEESDLVFPNRTGRPMDNMHLLRRELHPLLRRAGLPSIRFHDLRHTAATLALAQGQHPKIVAEMLGHSQIAITLDLYSHVIPGMQEQVAMAMEASLFG
jgi:integrase